MSLFRRNRGVVGQNTEPLGALGDNLSTNRRLALHTRMDADLDALTNALADIDTSYDSCNADYQRFTVHKSRQEHYRLMTQVRFMYGGGGDVFQDCAFYIEHPESKKLVPIVQCIRDRHFNGNAVVWTTKDDLMVVPESTTMYVSDEPGVAGKTLTEVWARYGED